MNRYQNMFQTLAKKNEGAFIPFVMLGDPTLGTCQKILKTLVSAGVDSIEVGIPFSDPIADGPTIQKAGLRAQKSGATVETSFALIKELRALDAELPIGVLTYSNLVVTRGLDFFYEKAKASGVDSVLVADVPLVEYGPFHDAAIKHGIDSILIAPINLPDKRIAELARYGGGYTYIVTRKGVTGADQNVVFQHRALLERLQKEQAPPPVFGFGISTKAHVREALQEGARGAIIGSAIVEIIERNLSNENKMLQELGFFAKSMKEATRSI